MRFQIVKLQKKENTSRDEREEERKEKKGKWKKRKSEPLKLTGIYKKTKENELSGTIK